MEPFYGKPYELVKTENFDEFLKYLDIGYFQRQVALTLRPVQYLVRNGDGTFTLHFKSVAVLYQLQFVPGVEFDETKPDGVKVRGLITIRGNKLYHRQVEACGRTIHHVYEFYKDKMTITSTSPGLQFTVKRHYLPVG